MSRLPPLSVITVCMNRQQHLLATAPRLADWPHHQEHLIIDWSSDQPIRRQQLPDDSRIQLHRVVGESRWNLARAYNLAAVLAKGSLLLKLDADCWPGALVPEDILRAETSSCWFGSGPDGRLGQFLLHRKAFESVGGFNEVLIGYGFDDKDLKARLQSLGWQLADLPVEAIGVIPHSIHERTSRNIEHGFRPSPLLEAHSQAHRRATAMSNRLAAAFHPWTALRAPSRYQPVAEGLWRGESEQIPRLRSDLDAELERSRRQMFWSHFLEIPELHVKLLPALLLPPDQDGHFQVCWWHRLYWQSLRRLLRLPLFSLRVCKGLLRWFR
ncbi:MAG: glycosyltransferase family 2 protein [Prochlorococcus sp.]